jgi:hypothetical protein
VWHDPVHRKQQYTTVTKMARHAASDLGADWVINADADEFWVPTAEGTLRDALAQIDESTPYLTVPVVNLTGPPAKDGSGLERLVYRDLRSADELRAVGIPFPPTADALHRGNPLVEVAQGNHFVTAPGWTEGAVTSAIEVLHLPWRSWHQYEHKVRIAGEAYLSNPDLTPSPRHHGMQDFRRWEDGRLEYVYVAKHPTPAEIDAFVDSGSLVHDERLRALATRHPDGMRADLPYSAAEAQTLSETGRLLASLESTADRRYLAIRDDLDKVTRQRDTVVGQLHAAQIECDRLQAELDRVRRERDSARGRMVVRITDSAAAAARRLVRPRRRDSTTSGNNSG